MNIVCRPFYKKDGNVEKLFTFKNIRSLQIIYKILQKIKQIYLIHILFLLLISFFNTCFLVIATIFS
jgi:hypothetical protein